MALLVAEDFFIFRTARVSASSIAAPWSTSSPCGLPAIRSSAALPGAGSALPSGTSSRTASRSSGWARSGKVHRP